jgi:hypothetical protein
MGDKKDSQSRLGVTFHRTLPLTRSALSPVLELAVNTAKSEGEKAKLTRAKIQASTLLGSIYVEAVPRYCYGAGLLNRNYLPTNFGYFANKYDAALELTGTQWMMHYYFSSPNGVGPAFWHHLISNSFYAGNVFSRDDIVEQIGNYIWQIENKILNKNDVGATAAVFLGAYTKSEGLGKLSLLESNQSGRYRVREGAIVSAWIVGYALLDFWAANYPGRVSVGLDTLHDSGFAKLFLMGKADLENALQVLQEERYLEIHRTAPPYQVVLLRPDPESLLRKIYGAD